MSESLKILVLYGGKNATIPRDDLIDWLNSRRFQREIGREIDAKKVAEMTAHMEDSIDIRVEKAMEWADKAIILLTDDERSEYGAPNVLEEFGRWIGQKGRRTAITLRQEGVKVHSNASGLVYVGFKDGTNIIEECRERIIKFINDPVESADDEDAKLGKQLINQSTTTHTGDSISIGGDVGGDVMTGDKVGGNVYNISGDATFIHGDGSAHSKPKDKAESSSSSSGPLDEESAYHNELEVISDIELKDFLVAKFSKKEMEALCFEMKIDPDEIGGGNKTNFAINLILYVDRRSMFTELIEALKKDQFRRLKKEFKTENIEVSTKK